MLKLFFSLSIIFLYSNHSYALSKDDIVNKSITVINFVAEKLFNKSIKYDEVGSDKMPINNDNKTVPSITVDDRKIDNKTVAKIITDNITVDNQTVINNTDAATKKANKEKENANKKAEEIAKAEAEEKAKNSDENKVDMGNRTYIANIFTQDVDNLKIIISDRKNKEVSLYQVENDNLNNISSFPAIYGSNEGDKVFRGDNKTPEGVYYITTFIDEETLIKKYGSYAPVYGEGAFPLDYPNPIDSSEKKTGGGIWLHGNSLEDKNITQGCVAFDNKNLNLIKQHVGVSTPVILTNNIIYTTKENYDKEKIKFISFAKSYINEKLNLDNNTDVISNLKIFTDNGVDYVIDFNIDSCNNGYILYNNIKYYFSNSGNQLKLINEKVTSLDIEGTKYKEIEQFTNNWSTAWQSQNIDNYISYYSDKFRADNRNFQQMKRYKTSIFKKNKGFPVNVKIDIKKVSIHNGKIYVQLRQQYSSRFIQNTGYKTLQLTGCNGNYSIVKESWNKL